MEPRVEMERRAPVRPPPWPESTRPPSGPAPPSGEPLEVSSGEGGLWNALRRRLGLAADARKEIALVVLVGCGPLLVADLVSGRSLVADTYVRAAFATPLLLVADRFIAWTTGMCSRRLVSDGIVPSEELGRYAQLVAFVGRLWAARLPEVLVLVAALAASPVAPEAGTGTFVRTWNEWVALVLFRFFMLRLLWRWAVWGIFCARLSRLRLSLAANHPDRAGGFSFVRLPSIALAPALTGWSCVVVVGFKTVPSPLVIGTAAVAGIALALLPPTLLAGRLSRARFSAMAAYGRAALRHGRGFRRRLEKADLETTEDIGASEQTDFGSEVERVRRMRPVPYGRETILIIAVLTLLPFLVQYALANGVDTVMFTLARRLLG